MENTDFHFQITQTRLLIEQYQKEKLGEFDLLQVHLEIEQVQKKTLTKTLDILTNRMLPLLIKDISNPSVNAIYEQYQNLKRICETVDKQLSINQDQIKPIHSYSIEIKSHKSSSVKKTPSQITQKTGCFLDHGQLHRRICKQTESESDLHVIFSLLKKDKDSEIREFVFGLTFPEEACIKHSSSPLIGDIALNEQDPMFSKLYELMANVRKREEKCHKGCAIQTADRLKAILLIYEKFIKKVCDSKGNERISLLIGKVRLYIQGECYFVTQKKGREMASLNPYGMTNCNNAYGAAAVAHVGSIYYKRPRQNPLAPGKDFAIHALHQLLCTRRSLTPTHLLKIENIWISSKEQPSSSIQEKYEVLEREMFERYQGQWNPYNQPGFINEKIFEHYPDFEKEFPFLRERSKHHMLASSGVEGKPLNDHYKNIEKCSFANFTSMCVLSLLVLPNDWRGDNFIVCPIKGTENKFDIVGIDNDGILTPAIVQRGNQHSLELKNSLFLLPQMHEKLDRKFIKFFLSTNPEEMMMEWFSKLKAENKQYQELKTQGIFTDGQYRELSLPLSENPQAFISCYKRLKKIHNFINNHKDSTHWDLVCLFPAIANIYEALLKKTNFDIALAERHLFHLWFENIKDRIDMIFEELNEEPIGDEINDLCWTGKKKSIDQCIQEFLDAVFPLLNNEEQARWLKSIFIYFPNQKDLHLKGCLLEDTDFLRHLVNHPLENLSLESCSLITDNGLLPLIEQQPDLHLAIGDCPLISYRGIIQIYKKCQQKDQKLSLILGGKYYLLEKSNFQELLTLCLVEEKIEFAKAIVHFGAEWNFLFNNKQSLMHKLAGKKCQRSLSILIKHGVKVNNIDSSGKTPLHFAAEEGQKENVELFLKNEADIDCRDTQGRTPLYLAVLNGHYETTKFLIDHHANPLICDKNEQQTVFHVAALYGYLEIVKLLFATAKELLHIRDLDGREALHLAVRSFDNYALVNYLIEQGSDPNSQNRFNYTPLHFAAQNGFLNCAKSLIHAGAKKEAYNVTGNDRGEPTTIAKDTPLDLAARYCRDELLFFLLYPEKDLSALPDVSTEELKKIYFELLKESQKEKELIKQIFFLNRMSDLHMLEDKKKARRNNYIKAAKFANAAFSLGLSTNNLQLIDALMIRLEKVEAEYLFSIGIKSSPSNQMYLKQIGLEFEKTRLTLEHEFKEQKPIQEIIAKYNLSIKALLVQSIDHAIEQMNGKPPCKYSFLTRGDLATGELLPHSDIELMLLVSEKNDKNDKYFKGLCKLIDLKLMNLGMNRGMNWALEQEEVSIRSAFCLYSNETEDFNYTKGHELIASPKEMADLQFAVLDDKKTFSFHTLCTALWLAGDEELSSSYQKMLKQIMKETKIKDALGDNLLSESLRKFHLYFFECHENMASLNLKRGLHDPMQGMIESLIFIYDSPLEAIATDERLRRLTKSKIFSKESADYLLKMSEVILKLRLEIHLLKGAAEDYIVDKSNNHKQIKEAYQLLFSLFKKMQEFFHQRKKDVFKNFGLHIEDKDRFVVRVKFEGWTCQPEGINEDPDLLISTGLFHQKLDAHELVIQNLTQARSLYEISYGEQSPLVGAISHLMGDVLTLSKQYQKALSCYEIDMMISQRFLGEKHADIRSISKKMANCKFYLGLDYQQREKWADALAYYESALKICPENLEGSNRLIEELKAHICESLEHYGSLLAELEKYQEALKNLQRASSLRKEVVSSEEDERLIKINSLIDYCQNRISGD